MSKLFRSVVLGLVAIFCYILTNEPLWQFFLPISAVIIHEIGHLCPLLFLRKKAKVGLQPFGLRISTASLGYKAELLVLISGPLSNFAAYWISRIILHEYPLHPKIMLFMLSNLSLGLFNLLPIATLDGGNILACVFHYFGIGAKGEKLLSTVSLTVSLALWLTAVYSALMGGGAYLIFLSLWLMALSEKDEY